MTDRDAYQDEMGFLHPRDADEVEFSSLVEEIRAAYVRRSDPAVEDRHLAAIVEHARSVPLDLAGRSAVERRAVSKPLGAIVKLGLAAAAVGLLSGGLALAGVDLGASPDRASGEERSVVARDLARDGQTVVLPDSASENAVSVLEAIDVNLPLLHDGELSGCEFGAMVSAAARDAEPDTSHCKDSAGAGEGTESQGETSQRVQATIEANLPLLHDGELSGCEFGAMVSAAARDAEPDTSRCDKNDGANDEDPLEGEASGKGRARAEAAKAAGAAKGEEASEGKANAGDSDSDKGGKSKSSAAGKATAESAKSSGQAKGEEASGGKANAGGKPTG